MIEITESSVGETWLQYLRLILHQGIWIQDDREPILEGPPAFIEIQDIRDSDSIIERYGDGKIIELYSRKMFSREIIAELNSTYGERLFNWDGHDQISHAIERLREKWWSKSAAIGLIAPKETMPRVPCLINLLPMIRGQKLILNATFRSQNAFNSYGNFIGLRSLQKMMAKRLDVAPGSIRIVAYSPHIYRSDVERAARVANVEFSEFSSAKSA